MALHLLLEPFFHPEWGKGNQGGGKDQDRRFEAPVSVEHSLEQGEAEDAEEYAVGHADDADRKRFIPDVFHGHGDEEQDEVGQGFDQADDAEAAEGCFQQRAEHAGLSSGCRGNEQDKLQRIWCFSSQWIASRVESCKSR